MDAAEGAAGCTFLRCITGAGTHPPAGKAYTRRAIACSPICWTEQQRPSPTPGCRRHRYFRKRTPPPSVASKRLRIRCNTCTRAFTHARTYSTLALAERRNGGWKLTETGKLALRNGASRRYRARNRPLAHDRGQCRGRGFQTTVCWG